MFEESLSLQPQNANAYNSEALVYYRLGDYHRAVDLFDMAIGIVPAESTFYYNKGNALLKLGKKDAALAAYNQAIEIRPFPAVVRAKEMLTREFLWK